MLDLETLYKLGKIAYDLRKAYKEDPEFRKEVDRIMSMAQETGDELILKIKEEYAKYQKNPDRYKSTISNVVKSKYSKIEYTIERQRNIIITDLQKTGTDVTHKVKNWFKNNF